jgi:hypothetical protein
MQHSAGSLELTLSLNEITGIRPESDMVFRYHYITCLSCKADEPFHLTPSWSRIFAAVRIASAYHHSIPAIAGHDVTQS